jgi:glycosyltransferase involved in cell wall biosynthesis
MEKPKISILAPVFNKGAWISETIQSLIKQTLEDIEIVFLDDGSTDNTAEIIKYYQKQDRRIRLYRFKKNKGLGVAWNTITPLAKADIICVASGDDIIVPKRAELTYSYFRKHSNCDVFYGSFYFCDYALRPIEYKPAIPYSKKKLITPRKDGYCPQYIGHITMAYKTKVGLDTPYRNFKVGIDYPFLVDLANKGYRFGWTKETLAYARLLKTGVSLSRREEVNNASKGL